MTRRGRWAVCLAAWTAVTVPAAATAMQEAPKNLQYFSPDMPRSDLIEEMRQFSFALGVRCQYCHVGGDGISFDGVVFESDEDPDKRKARFMLRLVKTLNEGLLPMMADRDRPPVRVTCKTCHRGLPRPALLTDVLRATLEEQGADAAKAQYEELREKTALEGMYDFGQWEMNTLAERLTAEERYTDAIAMYELNLESFPESVSIWLALGGLYEQVDEPATAIEHYRRVLELAPDNEMAASRLRALQGGGAATNRQTSRAPSGIG